MNKSKKFIYMSVHHLKTGKIFKSDPQEWAADIELNCHDLCAQINNLNHMTLYCADNVTTYIPENIIKESVVEVIVFEKD